MYLVISLLVLRAGCGFWLYQFLIIAYLFTLGKLDELKVEVDGLLSWRMNWVLDELKDELSKLDQLKDELDGLLTWIMSWIS